MLNLAPDIQIIESENKIIITGYSLPENPLTYYNPIFSYLSKLENNAKPLHLDITVDVELFSSSSLKIIVEVFSAIYNLHKHQITHLINWLYIDTDEDAFEKGELAASVIPVNIKFVKK